MDHSADLTIFDLLRRQSTRTTPALLAHGVAPMTWASLFEFVCNLGQELDRSALQGGMRVALIMPNGPEAALALLAFSSFVTTAPLNPGCRKPELEFAFKDLGGKLRFKVKAVCVQDHSIQDLTAEYFITSFHVGENCVVKDIGHEGQHSVGDQVPEHGHAMRAP